MKDKLLQSESENESLNHQLNSTELNLRDKERLLMEQNEREILLRKELDEHQIR